MPSSRTVYLPDALDAQLSLEAQRGPLTAGRVLTVTLQCAILGKPLPVTLASRVYAEVTLAPEPMTAAEVCKRLGLKGSEELAHVNATLVNLHRLTDGILAREDDGKGNTRWSIAVDRSTK